MRAALFVLSLLVFGVVTGLGGYYAGGRSDAIDDARPLARLADRLIRHGKGAEGLGARHAEMLLAAEDAQLTRSLAKRLAFDRYEPGVTKIREVGYASGLEAELSQPHLLALWLETVEMGRGPKGWMKGFYEASRDVYHRPPERLSDDEFLHLLAAADAPSRFHLERPDPALEARVERLRQRIGSRCLSPRQGAAAANGCVQS